MFWGAGLEPKKNKYLFDPDGIGKTGMNENYREQEGLVMQRHMYLLQWQDIQLLHLHSYKDMLQLGSVPLLL